MVVCGDCGLQYESLTALSKHYSNVHFDSSTFKCGMCNKRFSHKNSLIRHLTTYHENANYLPNANQAHPLVSPAPPAPPPSPPPSPTPSPGPPSPASLSPSVSPPPELTLQETVDDAAVNLLINIRSTASLTGKAIERFENGCNQLLQDYSSSVKAKLEARLKERGLDQEDINALLSDIEVENPFRDLKSIDDQLNHFNEKFGLPIPEEKYLDHRIDKRLDPKSNSYIPVQVTETYQYIKITDTLKAIVTDKERRNLLFEDLPSQDGNFRSHADGYHFQNHQLLRKHVKVFNILLYYDELEIANNLGSKTIIHKLGAFFFFQILNLPADQSSELSSIYLPILVHADDMKKEGAFRKVLTPIIQEIKKLASDEGVTVVIDNDEVVLRAVLTAFTADSLAAHDLMGFLGPGAHRFCRKCMVHRYEVRANANAIGVPRTKEMHQFHVAEVSRRRAFSTECGVKRSCPLDEIPYFSCVENTVFDAFHDILEGVGPLVVKLVLREYVVVRELFTVGDFNGKIASFSYGIPDSRNKPSANFTREMLTKRRTNLKQTGSQMWCLIRSLPFLIRDYLGEEVGQHMLLVFLLQDIMKIIFSFEIAPEDVDHLEELITRHNSLFEDLFITTQLVVDEGDEDEPPAEEGEDEDEPAEMEGEENDNETGEEINVEGFKVHVINKLHHLKHYGEMIRQYGNPVRVWCAKFEARLKIFRQHSSVCCNFKNPPKTMAKMFQLSNLKSVRREQNEDRIEHHKGTSMEVSTCPYVELLRGLNLQNETVLDVNSATVRGEEYRPGLFLCLPNSTPRLPLFGMIQRVLVTSRKSVVFIVTPWKNLGQSLTFNTFRVCPEDDEERGRNIALDVSSLAHYRCISPWSTSNDEVHMSLRTVLV